jgi:undecaprenyl-diphosphatase
VTRRGPARPPAAAAQSVAEWLASRAAAGGGPVRRQVTDAVRQLAAVDRAVYDAIAATPTPALDEPLRRLSQAANKSRLWLATAALLAAVGGPAGRRAAVRGTLAIGTTSALVNLGLKPLSFRGRPDRDRAGVPGPRQVRMPASTSFPSGHSASAFAFATAISREQPWVSLAAEFLAAAVAYSRVHTGVHYPGDAVIGSIIGASAGLAVTGVLDRWYPRPAPAHGDRSRGPAAVR